MAITRGKLKKSKTVDNLYACLSCGKHWKIIDEKLIPAFED